MFRSPPDGLRYWIVPIPLAADPRAPLAAKLLWGFLYARSAEGPVEIGTRALSQAIFGRPSAKNSISRATDFLVSAGWLKLLGPDQKGRRKKYSVLIPEGVSPERDTSEKVSPERDTRRVKVSPERDTSEKVSPYGDRVSPERDTLHRVSPERYTLEKVSPERDTSAGDAKMECPHMGTLVSPERYTSVPRAGHSLLIDERERERDDHHHPHPPARTLAGERAPDRVARDEEEEEEIFFEEDDAPPDRPRIDDDLRAEYARLGVLDLEERIAGTDHDADSLRDLLRRYAERRESLTYPLAWLHACLRSAPRRAEEKPAADPLGELLARERARLPARERRAALREAVLARLPAEQVEEMRRFAAAGLEPERDLDALIVRDVANPLFDALDQAARRALQRRVAATYGDERYPHESVDLRRRWLLLEEWVGWSAEVTAADGRL